MTIMKMKINFIFLSLLFLAFSCKKDNVTENSCKDSDGNTYKTVQIGDQVWMAENLKTTRYNNGDLIDITPEMSSYYARESNPKYQWPANAYEPLAAVYGRLYTWFVITDSRNICPTGWHIPNQQEWMILINYLGGYKIAGGKLKETGDDWWYSPNTGADNSSGFSALPSGDRDLNGYFKVIGGTTRWWSSTIKLDTDSIFTPSLNYDDGVVHLLNTDPKRGFSIRCIKD
jgi:uncharacterized protein (TIGR02145 family)